MSLLSIQILCDASHFMMHLFFNSGLKDKMSCLFLSIKCGCHKRIFHEIKVVKYIFISNGLNKDILVLLLRKKDKCIRRHKTIGRIVPIEYILQKSIFYYDIIYNPNAITNYSLKVVVHSFTSLDYSIGMFQIMSNQCTL